MQHKHLWGATDLTIQNDKEQFSSAYGKETERTSKSTALLQLLGNLLQKDRQPKQSINAALDYEDLGWDNQVGNFMQWEIAHIGNLRQRK